jgi:hypothetical protein
VLVVDVCLWCWMRSQGKPDRHIRSFTARLMGEQDLPSQEMSFTGSSCVCSAMLSDRLSVCCSV